MCKLSVVATVETPFSIDHGYVPANSIVYVQRKSHDFSVVRVPKDSQMSSLDFNNLTEQVCQIPTSSIKIEPMKMVYKSKKSCLSIEFGYVAHKV